MSLCIERCGNVYFSDKENLDRSSDRSASGFDSPAGKLVSAGRSEDPCVVHVYSSGSEYV